MRKNKGERRVCREGGGYVGRKEGMQGGRRVGKRKGKRERGVRKEILILFPRPFTVFRSLTIHKTEGK